MKAQIARSTYSDINCAGAMQSCFRRLFPSIEFFIKRAANDARVGFLSVANLSRFEDVLVRKAEVGDADCFRL